MLRYQLNPHFLFNTLNAIQSLVTSRQTERATGMIASLSDFLRYSLYASPQGNVTVAQEVDALQRYLEIEQARFGERLRTMINVEAGARDKLIPCMLLQPLVENAIKHAIAPSEDGGELWIHAYCDGDTLSLEVIDSGTSTPEDASSGPGGVGLTNIRQRLENNYGSAHQFLLLRRPEGGLRAVIRVPAVQMAQIA
jgi:LytS/YehU family sensor histidine kinase